MEGQISETAARIYGGGGFVQKHGVFCPPLSLYPARFRKQSLDWKAIKVCISTSPPKLNQNEVTRCAEKLHQGFGQVCGPSFSNYYHYSQCIQREGQKFPVFLEGSESVVFAFVDILPQRLFEIFFLYDVMRNISLCYWSLISAFRKYQTRINSSTNRARAIKTMTWKSWKILRRFFKKGKFEKDIWEANSFGWRTVFWDFPTKFHLPFMMVWFKGMQTFNFLIWKQFFHFCMKKKKTTK